MKCETINPKEKNKKTNKKPLIENSFNAAVTTGDPTELAKKETQENMMKIEEFCLTKERNKMKKM